MKPSRETIGERSRTHGMTETRLYRTWCGIKDRCYNPNVEHYNRYGGRGIKVCDSWKESFEAFRDWAISAGYDEAKTGREQSLDRINVNGDYEPDNCRWISMKQQARNRSDTVFIETENGITPVREFCEDHGITYEHFVLRHLERGYSLDEIIRIWNFKSGKHDGFYSLDEAALFYSVGTQSILHWIRDGKIKAEKVGRSWYIPHGQEINRREDRNELGQFLPGFSRPRGKYK